MLELGMARRDIIQELCAGRSEAPVRAAAEGAMGRVWIPASESPSFCLVSLGAFTYLLGIPPRGAESIDLYLTLCRECIRTNVSAENALWSEWLEDQFQGRFRTSARYSLGADEEPDPELYEKYVRGLPDGIALKALDPPLYRRAMEERERVNFVSSFADEQQFLQFGKGWAAISEDGRLVGGCAAYVFPTGLMEVRAATAENFRGRGIASALTASLLLDCERSGVRRSWDAANLFSARVAEKLGYRLRGEYAIYHLAPEDSPEEGGGEA